MLNFLGPISKIYEKVHDSVDEWNSPAPIANHISSLGEEVVEFLNQVPGMTQTYSADLKRATPHFTLRDGSVLKVWRNPVGCNYVFIADCDGSMVFGGFVGWVHNNGLNDAIAVIKREFT
jgi:hypothetical protein